MVYGCMIFIYTNKKIMNIEKLISEYRSGKSIRELSKNTGYSREKITKILKENNIYILSNVEKLRKYEINEHYFDNIDNEHKSYTLGFLYADGYHSEKQNIIKISLKEEDVEILKKIKEPICPDKPLRYYKYKNYNSKPQYSFVIDNGHISRKLKELGFVQAKTFKLEFPKFLDKSLIRHFIRGYFDGDGCITKGYTKTKYPKYFISFLSTEMFLDELQNYFSINLDIKKHKLQTRFPERNNNIRTLGIGGNLQVEKILNHLYNNSTIYLERKYDNYLKLKELNSKH